VHREPVPYQRSLWRLLGAAILLSVASAAPAAGETAFARVEVSSDTEASQRFGVLIDALNGGT
jgi:hypothetical protein